MLSVLYIRVNQIKTLYTNVQKHQMNSSKGRQTLHVEDIKLCYVVEGCSCGIYSTRYSNYMLHIADSWPGTTFRGYRGKRGLSFRDRLLQDLCLDFALLRDEILCAGFFWSLIVFSRDAERHEDSTNIEVVHWKFNWCFSIIIWSIGIVCQRGHDFDRKRKWCAVPLAERESGVLFQS